MDVLLPWVKIKRFSTYVNYKGRAENTGPLQRKDNHLTNRDRDKTEVVFKAFFASVFSTDDGLRDTQCPELENHDCKNNQLPADLELVWDLLFQLYPYKSIGSDRTH